MKRKSAYRKILILLLCLNITALIILTYIKLDGIIPDQIKIMVGEDENFDFKIPLLADFEEENVGVLSVNNKTVPANQIKINLNKPFTLKSTTKGEYTVSVKLFGLFNFKQVEIGVIDSMELLPSGKPIGIYIETDGVMVLGTGVISAADGLNYEPSLNKIKSGDYITAVNDVAIKNKKELIDAIQNCNGENVKLDVRRDEKNIEYMITPVKTANGEYKIGAWIRDNTQGIGTMTFVTPNDKFGALGHGITDVDTSLIMQIERGYIYSADIMSIIKGRQGVPGELIGLINQNDKYKIGEISRNTNHGIYGYVNNNYVTPNSRGFMEVGLKQEVQLGPASILCCVDNEVKEYSIEIQKIDINSSSPNKGMVIRITDNKLLQMTGGIVQGMSGSPILQNNKIIGAVTHVFIQDSTKGYGTFIENMIGNLEE